MRTRRTTPAPDHALPARDVFESSALYDLIASLAVHSYDDLLAPHWTVPDRPASREHLEQDRFTRRRSRAAARAAMGLHEDRSLGSRRDMRGARAIVFREADAPAALESDRRRGPEPPPDAHERPRALLARLRLGLTRCAAWVRRLLARRRSA